MSCVAACVASVMRCVDSASRVEQGGYQESENGKEVERKHFLGLVAFFLIN